MDIVTSKTEFNKGLDDENCAFGNLIKDFHTKGYVFSESVFNQDELIHLRGIAEKLISDGNCAENHKNDGHWNSQGYLFNRPLMDIGCGDKVAQHLHKIQGVCVVNPLVLEKVFKHPRIVSAVHKIMNVKWNLNDHGNDNCTSNSSDFKGSIDVFGTKFFPVFPGGNSVNWHQDSHYFGTGPSQKIVSCAVYIEKTDVENGCLRLIPASHHDGIEYPHQQGVGKWTQGEWVNVDCNDNLKSRILEFICPKPGTVALFDARLLHAANENVSLDRTRWSFFGHYVPGDLEFKWRGIDFGKTVYKDRHVVTL